MAATAAPEDFPSVDEVLNKLKSNGTFDLFRKTCLASVQAEPSFRAYGEHIEVVARRYLQNFKWRDTTTKNQVRSRLKDHALGVIESPDIQVGVPFSLLVEKAMETKGKELLPKIMEVVDTLRLTKPIHVQTSEPSSKIKFQDNSLHKSGLDFDLSLPIDIPGLVSTVSKRDSVESANKSVKSKQKLVDSNMKGGGMKVKAHVSDGNTVTESLKDVKTKEKDREVGQKLVPLGDGKRDCKAKVIKPKKVKEDMWEKDNQDKQKDIGLPCVEGTSGKREKEKFIKEMTDKKVKQGDWVSDRKEEVEEVSERRESVERTSDTKLVSKEIKSEENSLGDSSPENRGGGSTRSNDDDKKKSEQEKKRLPPRRRSVRLASLTEEQKKDEVSDDEFEEEADKQQLTESEFEVRASKAQGNRKRKVHTSGPPSQKRAKAYLDSSSEDSGEEIYHFTKRREASEELRHYTKKSIRRKHPYKPDQETGMDIGSTKRARRLSRTASPASTCSNSSTLMVDGQGVHHSILEQTKTRKRKNKCPRRFSELSRDTSKSPVKSPPLPVVVTRSNRHVKPNRRYYDNMSDEEMECEVDDSSGQSDVEGNVKKHYTNLIKSRR